MMADVPEPTETEMLPKSEEEQGGKNETTALSLTQNMEVEDTALPLAVKTESERREDVKVDAESDSNKSSEDLGFKLPKIGPVKKRVLKPDLGPLGKEKIFPKPEPEGSEAQAEPAPELSEPRPKEIKQESVTEPDIPEPGQEEGDGVKVKEEESKGNDNNDAKPQTKSAEPPSKLKHLSPAEQIKHVQQTIPYLEPKWAGRTDKEYYIEVLKGGKIVHTIDLTEKSHFVFGRLPTCDVPMDHPSLSRFHAVLQYCAVPNERHEIGWYLYDLESTHGTCINKLQVKPRVYYRVRVGHVLKFAGSTRLHILQVF